MATASCNAGLTLVVVIVHTLLGECNIFVVGMVHIFVLLQVSYFEMYFFFCCKLGDIIRIKNPYHIINPKDIREYFQKNMLQAALYTCIRSINLKYFACKRQHQLNFGLVTNSSKKTQTYHHKTPSPTLFTLYMNVQYYIFFQICFSDDPMRNVCDPYVRIKTYF